MASPGFYVPGAGAEGEAECPVGTFSGSGASECAPCLVAHYAATAGLSSCTLADAGFHVPATGASEQTPCPSGTYSGNGASECTPCAVRTYASFEGQSSCSLADAGFYVPEIGALEQTACPAGNYSGSGASSCSPCEVGTYSDEKSSSCTSCPAGESSATIGAKECSPCPPGTSKGAGPGECVDCAVAMYAATAGLSSCTLADAGFHVPATGASEQMPCPSGTYSGNGASECTPCLAGTYNSLEGQTSCLLADASNYVPAPGASEQTACPAGNYSGSGASSCSPCEVGTYSDEKSSSCTSCPAGESSATIGAKECSPCPLGTFKGAGAGACVPCPVKTYADEQGSSACKFAEAGSFVNETGATATTPCPAGTSSSDASSECNPCEVGTYSDEKSSSCTSCPSGYSSTATAGASECSPCPPGYSKNAGAGACVRCTNGTYASGEGSSSCPLCSWPLTTRGSGSTSCDACVEYYYWSAADTCGEEQCPESCSPCEDGHSCPNPGSTIASLGVKSGHWRASTSSAETYECPWTKNCPGDYGLAGDALCGRHSKGALCNSCQSGYYLVTSGKKRGKCARCSDMTGGTTALLFLLLFVLLGTGVIIARSDVWPVNKIKKYIKEVPEEHWQWYYDNCTTLFLAAQTAKTFVNLEDVDLPAPFSWLVRALDFLTLGPLAELFFSPCASFISHYTSVVLTTLFPLLLGAGMALVAIPVYFCASSDRGWSAWRAAMNRSGLLHYVTILLLSHTSIAVKTLEHFRCEGPFEDEKGKAHRHLATDYSIKCDSSEYLWFSVFAGGALFFYVIALPAGVLLWLKSNRPADYARTPQELVQLDGVLATLTTKYSQQYWWFEYVDVLVRLCFCGLSFFIFPTSSVLRCALNILVVVGYMIFIVAYKPVALASSRAVTVLAGALYLLLAVGAFISMDVASENVQVGYSCGLFVFTLTVIVLLRHIKASEPQYALVASIMACEPFEIDEFEAVTQTRSGSVLYDAVALTAKSIAKKPTEARMKYLKQQLVPLDAVWQEEVPAEMIFKERKRDLELLLASSVSLDKDGVPTLAAVLKYLFNDIVDYCAAFPEAANDATPVTLTLELLVERFAGARWTHYIGLRLDALWAMRATTGIMHERCDSILADKDFGERLKGQKDLKGSTEQPVLRRDDIVALIDALGPGASEKYRRSVDQKALPEMLKAMCEEGFADFLCELKSLIPGARMYSHSHGHDEKKPSGGGSQAQKQPGGGGAKKSQPKSKDVEVRLENIYPDAATSFGQVNPMHTELKSRGEVPNDGSGEIRVQDVYPEVPSTRSFDIENPLRHALQARSGTPSAPAPAPAAPAALPAPLGLPLGWTERVDESSGSPYYYHEATERMSWERPFAEGTPAVNLPGGWTQLVDENSGLPYYRHDTSGEVFSEPPPAEGALTPAPTAVATDLPEGWSQLLDQNGSPYYYHEASGTSSWERPVADPEVRLEDVYPDAESSFSVENPMRKGGGGAPPAAESAGREIELPDVAAPMKNWSQRCLIKCDPSVSIKGTSRTGAKIADYEKDKGPGNYPYCAFVGDGLRASVLAEDAESFWQCWSSFLGDPDDPNQKLKVVRLKNKIGKNQEPFNFHLNALFQPSALAEPLVVEIQIWIASIMELNDISHAQYEISRAKTPKAI